MLYFYITPNISIKIENQPNKLNIEFLEHMGYCFKKSDVEGFDPDTYFELTTTVFVLMKNVRN
jgi:hypothetical protein